MHNTVCPYERSVNAKALKDASNSLNINGTIQESKCECNDWIVHFCPHHLQTGEYVINV